jgi:hypothetical protein
MEAIRSSKTSVLITATQRHIPEDSILHSHRHENLRSYSVRVSYRLQIKLIYSFSGVISISSNISNSSVKIENTIHWSITFLKFERRLMGVPYVEYFRKSWTVISAQTQHRVHWNRATWGYSLCAGARLRFKTVMTRPQYWRSVRHAAILNHYIVLTVLVTSDRCHGIRPVNPTAVATNNKQTRSIWV